MRDARNKGRGPSASARRSVRAFDFPDVGIVDGPSAVVVDHLSFVVRAQKFRIIATIMRRSSVPLATEYALRLVHLIPELTADDLGAYFGFDAAELQVLVQDMMETGFVGERDGRFVLSERGRGAVLDHDDEVEFLADEEVAAHQAYDLIAFAPASDVELTGLEARLVPEIEIADRERAARGASAARDAFELHFREWAQHAGRMRHVDDVRPHTVEDVQFVRTFGAPYGLPILYRPDEATSGPTAVEPDFSSLRSQGRAGSRDPLVEAFSAKVRSMSAPSGRDEALAVTADVDGGILVTADLASAAGQAAWTRLCSDDRDRMLIGAQGPGRRLVGAATCTLVMSAILPGFAPRPDDVASISKPTIWLPPRAVKWGRSIEFAALVREHSALNPDGTVLLARTDGTPRSRRGWDRLYGPRPTQRQRALFDSCLAVRTGLPDALEVVLRPDAWVLVLVHVAEAHSGYPIPFGYVSAEPGILSRWRLHLAEVAGTAGGSGAVLWHDEDSPAMALARIDLALGIEAAECPLLVTLSLGYFRPRPDRDARLAQECDSSADIVQGVAREIVGRLEGEQLEHNSELFFDTSHHHNHRSSADKRVGCSDATTN